MGRAIIADGQYKTRLIEDIPAGGTVEVELPDCDEKIGIAGREK